MRVQWRPRINLFVQELLKAPAVLRLSYVADTEDAALVDQRLKAVKRQVIEAWDAANSYPLTIEPEVFWRRGGQKTSRSEEHTSELQSQSNLVCRLLLEKKKKKQTN